MASDPTIPKRLAALGFVPGPGCWVTHVAGTDEGHVVHVHPDGSLSVLDAESERVTRAPARKWRWGFYTPENRNAAIDFLADRLAGKRVPLPEGWRWVDPVIGTPYLRNRADDKILSDDCDGWTLKRCEPPEVGAWLIAKGHANAGVRMRGMAQSVADLEQLSATRGASTAGTESETP